MSATKPLFPGDAEKLAAMRIDSRGMALNQGRVPIGLLTLGRQLGKQGRVRDDCEGDRRSEWWKTERIMATPGMVDIQRRTSLYQSPDAERRQLT